MVSAGLVGDRDDLALLEVHISLFDLDKILAATGILLPLIFSAVVVFSSEVGINDPLGSLCHKRACCDHADCPLGEMISPSNRQSAWRQSVLSLFSNRT
ncbi:hypothetical protein D3C86_1379030 [compost metagenome]